MSDGLNELIAAENEANAMIEKARMDRQKIVREARERGKAEVERERANKEAAYKEEAAKAARETKEFEERIGAAADTEIDNIRKAGKDKADVVIKILVDSVTTVKL